jgi:hypothetical protein
VRTRVRPKALGSVKILHGDVNVRSDLGLHQADVQGRRRNENLCMMYKSSRYGIAK